jgi:hypothetical protein
VSTLTEIQVAFTHLPDNERKALQFWLNSMFEPDLSAPEEERLLRSLDVAIRDINAGKGIGVDEVRKRVSLPVVR